MSESYAVKPDSEFLHRLLEEGGEDLKKCFQCATCSVACELSNERKPFPRKEMAWAQWGLKDRLIADPDVWLCHQCNDCTKKCPRGARPGDVLAAVRQQAVQHYAVPRGFGAAVNRMKNLPILLAVPVVLLIVALMLRDPLWNSPLHGLLAIFDHEGFYARLYPHWLLIGFFTFFWGLGVLAVAVGAVRFWQAMKAGDEASGGYAPVLGIVPSLIQILKPVFTHEKFSKCTSSASRRLAHLGAFYGFVALFLVSVWAVIALYMINPFLAQESHLHYPFAWWNPWKLLANAAAIILIAGCVKAILDRKDRQAEFGASSSFDWMFVWLLLAIGVTGLLTEVLRWIAEPEAGAAIGGLQYFTYTIYFIHLVFVFQLLVYLPYSKFAHIVYRTVALVYAEHTGRTQVVCEPAPAGAAGQNCKPDVETI